MARSGCTERTTPRVSGQNDETTTSATRPAATTSSTTSRATRSSGSKPGSPGRFLISMLTVSPAQASRAAGRSGTHGGRSATFSSATGPGPRDHRVVVDGQPGVRGQPDVQLDPVGAQLTGSGERFEGVLDDPTGPVGAAPVGQNRYRTHVGRPSAPLAGPGPKPARMTCAGPQNCLRPRVPVITLVNEP